jgi:hypothetical protein
MRKAGKKSFFKKLVAKVFRGPSGKIESRKRGRPVKRISDLSEKQVEVLLSPLTCREKAAELDMSVGWVAKWEKRLRQEMVGTFRGLFTERSQHCSQK